VALLALFLQAIAITAPLGDADVLRRVLFVSSYLLLIAFAARNIRRPGIAVIGLGLLLNFAAVAANEGFMPITPEVVLRTGPLHPNSSSQDGAEPGRSPPPSRLAPSLLLFSNETTPGSLAIQGYESTRLPEYGTYEPGA